MNTLKMIFLSKKEKHYLKAVKFCLSHYEKVVYKKGEIFYYPDLHECTTTQLTFSSYEILFKEIFIDIFINSFDDFSFYEIKKELGSSFFFLVDNESLVRKKFFTDCLENKKNGVVKNV